jgi:hypothetical protein
MLVRLDTEFEETGEGGAKGGWEVDWVNGKRGMRAAGFCGPCLCLGVFLFL